MREIAEHLRQSVRPIVTYLFAIAFVVGLFMEMVPPDQFVNVAIMVISFWFGQREGEKAAAEKIAVAAIQQNQENQT